MENTRDVVAYLLEIGLVKAIWIKSLFVLLRKQQKVTVKFEPIAKQPFSQDYFKALSMTQLKAQIAEEKGLIEVIRYSK